MHALQLPSQLWHHHKCCTVNCDIITSVAQSIVTSSQALHSQLWHHHKRCTVNCDIITSVAQSIVTSSQALHSQFWCHHQNVNKPSEAWCRCVKYRQTSNNMIMTVLPLKRTPLIFFLLGVGHYEIKIMLETIILLRIWNISWIAIIELWISIIALWVTVNMFARLWIAICGARYGYP